MNEQDTLCAQDNCWHSINQHSALVTGNGYGTGADTACEVRECKCMALVVRVEPQVKVQN